MQPDGAARPWEARDAAHKITELVADRTWDDLQADFTLRWAVERGFTIIGEVLAQLRRDDPGTARQVPALSQIVGFRNVLVHGYTGIDHVTVWRTATVDVHELIAAVDTLLEPT
jgi:uncharacterized protein with HEPN domain